MRITVFSDIHGQFNSKKFNKHLRDNSGDILIFSGDLQLNNSDDGSKFIDWLHKQPFDLKIMTFGNHDGNWKYTSEYANPFKDIIILNNTYIDINGVRIFGSPHSVEYGKWWFMMKDELLADLWKKIPNDTNILITHSPPFGILDQTIDGFTTGSRTLSERISELHDLRYHIFGHIHEAYGTRELMGICFINASTLDEKYRLANPVIRFDYEGDCEHKIKPTSD